MSEKIDKQGIHAHNGKKDNPPAGFLDIGQPIREGQYQ